MIILKPKFEIIEQQYNKENLLTDMFKHIELCGRTCYKSEDKITETSYEKFVNMLTESKHGAMLEHGTVYLTIPLGTVVNDEDYICKMNIINFFNKNKYSVVKNKTVNKTIDAEINGVDIKSKTSIKFYYITTNWRVIVENQDYEVIKCFGAIAGVQTKTLKNSILTYITPPTEEHEKRYTVRFTYHLALARDVNRHRVQSVGEESTRYCNYSKDKFGSELNIIEPIWFNEYEKDIINNKNEHLTFKEMCDFIARGIDTSVMEQVDYWLFANMACEYAYIKNTTGFDENNWTAQKASLMLPLDTKTCSVHTAFASDWCHFFNLRALGTTGAPRPSAKEVAWPLMEMFIKNKWISEEMIDYNKYKEILEKYPNIDDYIKI